LFLSILKQSSYRASLFVNLFPSSPMRLQSIYG
jgi:hypothetical protein